MEVLQIKTEALGKVWMGGLRTGITGDAAVLNGVHWQSCAPCSQSYQSHAR